MVGKKPQRLNLTVTVDRIDDPVDEILARSVNRWRPDQPDYVYPGALNEVGGTLLYADLSLLMRDIGGNIALRKTAYIEAGLDPDDQTDIAYAAGVYEACEKIRNRVADMMDKSGHNQSLRSSKPTTIRRKTLAGETLITVVGNLVADPELRYTPSGSAVAKFRIASTPRAFDKATGEWKDGDALFLRCVAWRQMAENIAETLTKGMRVVVQGGLVQNNYETSEGEKRSSIELKVEEVGPSLRYATAKMTKTSRSSSGKPVGEDPWATAAPATSVSSHTEEPPF